MRRRKKADRAGLHAGRPAWAVGLVRGRGRAVSGCATSRGVVAAARPTSPPAARVHPWRHNQDPDPVSSRIRPGAAAASHPLHQCGAAPVAARALERDPGRAARSKGIAGPRHHASSVDDVAGGPDDALHLTARPAAATAGSTRTRRLVLVWDNLTGHKTPELVVWLCQHGVMPLYTPVGGSWLNMAESIERVLKRRALDGQHPHSPAEIGTWFEQTVRSWNEQPTPFVWNGKRRQRRRRSYGEPIHRLGGSGACTHKPLKRSRSAGAEEYQSS